MSSSSSSESTPAWREDSRSTSSSTISPRTRPRRSPSGSATPRRKRWHLNFTPTSSSWVNLVERWFKELTDKRLRRGVFTSVPDLIAAIEKWVEYWNDDPKPFVWHRPAAEIIEKVQRGRATLHQIKSTTDH